ncbi:MAG: hypothetical protein DRP11_03325 [Candidatus Aenigmatarchaeota archaeon]|nr:MAG: hypothetical protein DRP11_03325 [Candidatus Aenigmarchaeota archaeon]
MAEFRNEWKEYELVKLGGFWAFCVGIVEDNIGIKKVRIAKGKVKGKVLKDKEKFEYELKDKNDPITQVNRLNIKSREEWEEIKRLVEKYMKKIEKAE